MICRRTATEVSADDRQDGGPVSRRELPAGHLWVEGGGSDGPAPTLVLLHGLGATGEVWAGLHGLLDGRWPGRWVIPDLAGHGRSGHAAAYSFGRHAADVATLCLPDERVLVVGHSMGGVVGLALASGWFGVTVAGVVGLGIKVSWTEAELARAAELARRPPRWFERREEAAERFLRVAGLHGLAPPDGELVASGLASGDRGWRLAADPATAGVGAPDMAGLLAAARAPVRLARGEHDGLVTLAELRRLDPGAAELAGLGHNAHVEDPERVLDLAEQLV
jgi:pimeloyl-ACP methyl ester carboxylesterase